MPTKLVQFPNLLTVTPVLASGNSTAINLPTTSLAPYGIVIHGKFVLGSLTNILVVPQMLNPDGTTWEDVYSAGVVSSTGLLIATANFCLQISPFGCKQFRVRYVSTGTTTSSSLTIDATCLVIL